MYYTEDEILTTIERNFFVAEKDLKHDLLKIEELGEIIPGILHINDKQTILLEYANSQSLNKIERSIDEINSDPIKFMNEIIHPKDFDHLLHSLPQALKRLDKHNTISFFQRIISSSSKDRQANEYDLYFTATKLYGSNQTISISLPVSNLDNMAKRISSLLDENQFLKKNYTRFSKLTNREKQVLTLLAQGLNNPQIAEKLFIARSTVENHRKKIIAKLETNNYAQLIKVAQTFGLID